MTLKIFAVSALALIAVSPLFAAEEVKYDMHARRDPFVPLIGQERPASAVSLAEITSPDDVRLEGIAADAAGNRMAVVNGELVKENFKAGEVEIKKIMKNSVLLTISEQEYTIKLPDEGGKKSE